MISSVIILMLWSVSPLGFIHCCMSKPEGILKNLPDLDYGRDVKDIFYEDADEDGSGISDTQVKPPNRI